MMAYHTTDLFCVTKVHLCTQNSKESADDNQVRSGREWKKVASCYYGETLSRKAYWKETQRLSLTSAILTIQKLQS